MRIVSVKVNPIKINGEASQWGNGVCDKTEDLGGLPIHVEEIAVLHRRRRFGGFFNNWVFDFSFSPLQPYCSLHLHLHVSANPYTSGNIASRDSAPGIIVASGGWEGICFEQHAIYVLRVFLDFWGVFFKTKLMFLSVIKLLNERRTFSPWLKG